MLLFVILTACGPSQTELDATATQAAADIFATLTAQAPTATPTFTPSPTATITPTPTHTPTPTPGLSAVALTLGDLPGGFEPMPAAQLSEMQQAFPEGANLFAFDDNGRSQSIIGILIPYSSRAEQTAFDAALPQFVGVFATAVGAGTNPKNLHGGGDVGEARAGITSVSQVGSLSLRWDIVGFRRGRAAVLLIVAYPDGDKPAVPIGDLGRLLDKRILEFLGSHP